MTLAAHFLVALSGLFLAACPNGARPPEGPPQELPPPDLTFQDGGDTYVVVKGDAYRVTRGGGREFVDHVYDPEFRAKSYVVEDGQLFQKDPDSGRRYPVTRSFTEDFEGATALEDLLVPSRWHSDNTDPRRAGTENNYYDVGNRVSLARDVVHGGKASLRCRAAPSARAVSKASLTRNLFYFVKGDLVSFSAWFHLVDTPDIYDAGGFTLLDLESTFVKNVGLRIIIRRNDSLAFELELPKTQFPQERDSEIPFPTGRFVHVEAKALLSDEAGWVQIWQDGRKVLERPGRTLPLADTVYDRFEIGISAIGRGSRHEKVVYVDDVTITSTPLRN